MRKSLVALASVLAWIAVSHGAHAGNALYRVVFTDEAKRHHTVEGRLVVEAQDGGILLLARDGRLWNVTPEHIESRTRTAKTFKPFTAGELSDRLKSELGRDFDVTLTRRYVIASNAGKHYTAWCGRLFERLMSAFLKQWKSRELRVREPAAPLIALVFADRKQFAKYARPELGQAASSSLGYYSVRTNRVVLFDLTAGPNSRPARSVEEVVRKLGRNPFNAATIVHEATHQIAFNCGLHARYADNPLWLTEGMAMYFEPPDLRSPTGWRTPGKVNPFRLGRFRRFLNTRRKRDSLRTLVSSDKRLTEAKTSADAYAEAWALTWFLIRTRRKDYETFLKRVANKPPLSWDTPESRLKEFEGVFGGIDKLDAAFQRYFERLRR